MIQKQLIYENHQQNEIFYFNKLNVALSIKEAAFLLSIIKPVFVGSADETPPQTISKAVTGIKQE